LLVFARLRLGGAGLVRQKVTRPGSLSSTLKAIVTATHGDCVGLLTRFLDELGSKVSHLLLSNRPPSMSPFDDEARRGIGRVFGGRPIR
jgi:hypothetical protein